MNILHKLSFYFIRKHSSLNTYLQRKAEEKIKKMIATGNIVLVSTGFRCDTKFRLNYLLEVQQESLPFDSGFFPPHSIASVLLNKRVSLAYPDEGSTHCPCRKIENYNDKIHGLGVRFFTSSYKKINALAKDKKQNGINEYLDSTFGYYTLDKKNKFVLAHYNWHKFASQEKSKGIYDIKTNIENINNTLNRRIERLFEKCNKADYIIFVTFNRQKFQYMAIDDVFYSLSDTSSLQDAATQLFGSKFKIVKLSEINNYLKLLNIIYSIDCAKKSRFKNTLLKPFLKKKAFALCREKKFQEARAIANSVIATHPSTAWPYYIIAKVQWSRKERALALKSLEKAIELDPSTDYYAKLKSKYLAKYELK